MRAWLAAVLLLAPSGSGVRGPNAGMRAAPPLPVADGPRPRAAQPIQSPATTVPRVTSGITVWLMTMGQGDEVWELFGHNAIRIRDEASGTDMAYNWGMFSFSEPGFVVRFLSGDNQYWMAGYPTDFLVQVYQSRNRSVWMQRLNLTPSQAEALRDFVAWNSLPEHKYYRYDYFLDNCSTRVRDALDRVLGGALQSALAATPTATTYRWHTRRLTQHDLLTYTGIEVALGQPADRPLTAWDEAFLPVRLQQHLRQVQVPDPSGRAVPLVAEEQQVVEARRAPEPDALPRYLAGYMVIGLVLAMALMVAAHRAALGGGAARAAFGGAGTLWAALAGVLGLVLVLAWSLTRHIFWYSNENLLQLSPLLLVVAVLLPRFVRRGAGTTLMVRLVTLTAAISLLGFALKALPGISQVNAEVIAVALPMNLALAWGVRRFASSPTPAS